MFKSAKCQTHDGFVFVLFFWSSSKPQSMKIVEGLLTKQYVISHGDTVFYIYILECNDVEQYTSTLN